MSNPHDEIQCEDFYGDEPPYEDLDDPDCDDEDNIDTQYDMDAIEPDPDDDWVMADGTTGPVGMEFLASLTPEDFV